MAPELDSDDSESNSVPKLAGLFVDMFCSSIIDVAKELDIPCYLYFASPASFLSFILHLPVLDTQNQLTPEFAESDTKLVIPEDGYSCYMYHALRYTQTKGIVINTLQELESHALNSFSTSQMPRVYPIGPVLDLVGSAQWHPDRAHHESIIRWLEDQPSSSVVFLCFGSMGCLDEPQVREIAHGLERAGFRFLWSLREPPKVLLDQPDEYTTIEEVLPNGFLERTSEIGLVCGWISQVSILVHKAIGGFVSHCGWNSILESLWHGVPIATWPIYAEQQLNAFKMVKELGLAVEISLDYRRGGNKLVLAEEIERGIKRLMDGDGEVRKKVKEMSKKARMAVMENGSSYTSLGTLIEELANNF
ncbi:udp-glycosyltransferase 71k2 [Quercus suber]|uniref:Udp-glycosyltransferase 71k2 n=1 Tax=Quercus suber TaxID=58331 RepID=A0AAW0L420_QUESU